MISHRRYGSGSPGAAVPVLARFRNTIASVASRMRLDMSFNLIQQVRLAHALAESDFPIVIPAAESPKFALLKEKFGMRFLAGDYGDINLSPHLRILHDEPSTSIGDLNRPLIFPHAITSYCRALWSHKREHRYSFAGLVTPSRQDLIQSWIAANVTGRPIDLRSQGATLASKIRRKLFALGGFDDTRRVQIGDLMLWSSTRGRRFPIKSWDDKYANVLAHSQFVLCPSGDHVWSYRFFESLLCGAIPIVETRCPAYEGFRFLTFDDRVDNVAWSETDAEHNFRRCVARITLPGDELNKELARLRDA
jgi:hypothetical protein